jgi:phage baseplate assembly protein W
MTQIAYPWRLDRNGRTASTDEDSHVEQLVEQVLMTSPGERVNRPTFGSGLLRVPFSGLSDNVAATTQFLVQGALQQWLGDRIEVHGVLVDAVESTLQVTVQYMVRRTQEERTATFTREV